MPIAMYLIWTISCSFLLYRQKRHYCSISYCCFMGIFLPITGHFAYSMLSGKLFLFHLCNFQITGRGPRRMVNLGWHEKTFCSSSLVVKDTYSRSLAISYNTPYNTLVTSQTKWQCASVTLVKLTEEFSLFIDFNEILHENLSLESFEVTSFWWKSWILLYQSTSFWLELRIYKNDSTQSKNFEIGGFISHATGVNSGSYVCYDLQCKDLRLLTCKTELFRWYPQTSKWTNFGAG